MVKVRKLSSKMNFVKDKKTKKPS